MKHDPIFQLLPAAHASEEIVRGILGVEEGSGEDTGGAGELMSLDHESFLTNLPSGWKFDRFKDVAILRNERTDEASEVEDYLELEDIEPGTGRILNRRNTMEVISDVTVFNKGDVLFGKLRPYLEKYYVAEFDGKCTGEILAFKPKRIESRFLFYCMASSWFIQRCNMLAYGTKMPRVNWPTQLAQFNLPLPPLSEQQCIAAYLDASCAAIDAAVAAKRRQIETLDALQKALVLKAITQGLHQKDLIEIDVPGYGATPKHWKKTKLRYEISIQNGDFASDKVQEDGPYAIYGGNGIMGRIDITNVDGETVVIGRVGAYCGNAQYVKGRVWVSDNALIIKSIHNARFLTHLFNVLNFNAQANATAQPVITGTKIKNTYVVLPPLLEQEEIYLFIQRENQQLEALRTIFKPKSPHSSPIASHSSTNASPVSGE